MAETVDSAAVRRSLDSARGQRTQITRGAPLPIDTAHVVGACPKCGLLGATILGFPDPPYAGPQGQPRYRNASELQRFVEEIFKNPPPLPAAEDPSENRRDPQDPRRTVPTWKGLCRCGAKVLPPQPDQRTGKVTPDPEATPRRVCAVRFIKAMPGSGAELVVEALSPDAGAVPFTDGATISFRVLKAPLDGVESESVALEESAVQQQFGRHLTLAETWRDILSRAAAGEEVVVEAEKGYWLWAGPKDNVGLNEKIAEVGAVEALELPPEAAVGKKGIPLTLLPQIAPMPQGPSFPAWAYEHAEKIAKGELRAGVVLDRAVVRKLVEAQLERNALQWQEQQGGGVVIATAGEFRWPVEMAIVALGAAHLGWFLTETTAAAVGEAMARVSEIKRYVDAARSERPDITFQMNGLQLNPKRADGSMGRPINLMEMPFRAPPGSPDFKRELKFVCDDIPKGANPTRLCPCGDRAWVAARIFPDRVLEEFKRATNDKQPLVIEQWKSAALLATISCDRHVRIPMSEELEGAGLKGPAFEKRMAEDLPNSIFAVDVSLHQDKAGKRALLAYGPLVASVVINDHLVAALHQACRMQDNSLPLRGDEAAAIVSSPNILVLHEFGFDDEQLDQVLDMGAAMDGIPANVDPPFDLSWDVSLKAAPIGRFVNLTQQPGQPGQQPPPPGGTSPAAPNGRARAT
ncbi:MAG: hypothetical protein U0326_10995 [Polyangiales bacterium]